MIRDVEKGREWEENVGRKVVGMYQRRKRKAK